MDITLGKYFWSCQMARTFITLLFYELLYCHHHYQHNNANAKAVLLQSSHGVTLLPLEASGTQNSRIKFSNVSQFATINTQDCSFHSFNARTGRKRRGKTNSD